jgi:hypothetical protein
MKPRTTLRSALSRSRSTATALGLCLWSVGFLVACASSARAQELAAPGTLVFGAERVFGLYFSHQSREVGTIDVESDAFVFGLGWTTNASPLTIPRVGVDYFLDEHLTVGGNLGLYIAGADADDTGVYVGGRVGYALRLAHEVTFWPRGGVAFAGADNTSVFVINLEGMFALAPADQWAVLAGPVLDLGLAGEQNDDDYSEILFGIMVGIVGWFDI